MLGSRRNFREVLELLELIESTSFELVLNPWLEPTARMVDYRASRNGLGG